MSKNIKYAFLLFLLAFASAFAQEKTNKDAKDKEQWEKLIKPVSHIIDNENIFSSEQMHQLEDIIKNYKKNRGIQFVIITENNADKFGTLTVKEAYKWENEKAENNGILLAISKNLHRMRIQNGDKVKERLSDAETRLIIDAFCVPKFKNNDYYQGTIDGMAEIIRRLNK